MKKLFKPIVVLLGLILLLPGVSSAAISFANGKWSSTFNYGPCTQRGGGGATDCAAVQNDGITWSFGADDVDGNYTGVVSAANNPIGDGGNGFRAWAGDGTNIGSGPVIIDLPGPQPEIWIRWYMRHEQGYRWSNLNYDKFMWVYSFQNTNVPAVVPEYKDDFSAAVIQGVVGGDYQIKSSNAYGWSDIQGGSTSSGEWHCYEVYLKVNSGASDGVGRMWIDGTLVAENTNVNFTGNYTAAKAGWERIQFDGNQAYPGNGGAAYIDWDDWVIYNTTPPNQDAQGNHFIGPIRWNDGSTTNPPPTTTNPPPTTTNPPPTTTNPPPTTTNPPPSEPSTSITPLFEEKFEDSSLSARGWYDNTSPVLSSVQVAPGSTKSLEFRYPVGATKPIAGGAMRKKFEETEAVYVSYYVKYSDNWLGSQKNYHPHEFYLMTNEDSDWDGMAYTHLTAYIEQNALRPRLALQDGRNIDTSKIGTNLVNLTENRGIAGCNGDSDGYGNGSCYPSGGGVYWNDKNWVAEGANISAGTWHKVEAYLKLNSIVNGKGVDDGVMQYWIDGQLVIDHKDVMFRTGQHPDMKFNQLIIAPWIGDGSPIDQTFWIDSLTVATGTSETENAAKPPAPTGLRIISMQ